ncbi:MAG: L-dopachrome tautomerase-related protein [Pseudomonadota bacterium]
MKRRSLVAATLPALILMACSNDDASAEAEQVDESAPTAEAPFVVFAELDKGPGNITVTPTGEVLVSLHQFYGDDIRVASIAADGMLANFAAAANVNSVLGLQADANGVVWLLDNAMRGGANRRLVGWSEADNRVVAEIDLSDVTTARSFLNDLAVDAAQDTIFIADPAGGDDAAIIVVDTNAGTARRLLQGHTSVTPEDIDLVIDGTPVTLQANDGSLLRPRIGVNPIALDAAGDWLYYGPMHARSMYRVRAADLRDVELSAEDLSARVERWADKPICDGISVDDAGNVYLGDLAANAIGVIGQDRRYRTLIEDAQLSWVDAFSFGADGDLYAVVNQLHRSAVLNGGESAVVPPYLIVKFEPLASGTVGR